MEERILLLALRGRDAAVLEQLLERQGLPASVCDGAASLAAEIEKGAATAIITEESLADADNGALHAWLARQEPWSDFPFVLLATRRAGKRPKSAMQLLQALGNVVVLERPIHSETLASAVTTALRVRGRQYHARAQLQDLRTAEDLLTQLNATLEARIVERTAELSKANNELMREVGEHERA